MTVDRLLSELEVTKKIVISDHYRSYRGYEFVEEIRKVASQLNSLAIRDKKICVLRMANTIDCVTTFFALLLCRNVVFLENPHDPIQKTCTTIDKFSPFALFADKPAAMAVHKHFDHRTPCFIKDIFNKRISVSIFENNNASIDTYDFRMREADVAIFSSGSTGEPKAILHKKESLLLNARMHAESVGLKETDVVGVVLPLYYSYGLVANLLASLMVKARVVLYFHIGIVDANSLFDKQISVLSLTPYISRSLREQIPSLRVLTLGGDVLYSKQGLTLIQNYPSCDIFSTYGLTEAGPRVATWRLDKDILDRNPIAPLGGPMSMVSLSIKNDADEESQHGELVVTTPTRMLGYFLGNQKGFLMPEGDEGEVHTGDLFEKRNGNAFFVSRKKHVIMQRGAKLYPAEIESVIQNINGVIDVKVDSIQDEENGQIAKVYIVADKTLCSATVKRALMQQFPHSLIPSQLEFVNAISRTQIGKKVA